MPKCRGSIAVAFLFLAMGVSASAQGNTIDDFVEAAEVLVSVARTDTDATAGGNLLVKPFFMARTRAGSKGKTLAVTITVQLLSGQSGKKVGDPVDRAATFALKAGDPPFEYNNFLDSGTYANLTGGALGAEVEFRARVWDESGQLLAEDVQSSFLKQKRTASKYWDFTVIDHNWRPSWIQKDLHDGNINPLHQSVHAPVKQILVERGSMELSLHRFTLSETTLAVAAGHSRAHLKANVVATLGETVSMRNGEFRAKVLYETSGTVYYSGENPGSLVEMRIFFADHNPFDPDATFLVQEFNDEFEDAGRVLAVYANGYAQMETLETKAQTGTGQTTVIAGGPWWHSMWFWAQRKQLYNKGAPKYGDEGVDQVLEDPYEKRPY